jgi:hypothetical protein
MLLDRRLWSWSQTRMLVVLKSVLLGTLFVTSSDCHTLFYVRFSVLSRLTIYKCHLFCPRLFVTPTPPHPQAPTPPPLYYFWLVDGIRAVFAAYGWP